MFAALDARAAGDLVRLAELRRGVRGRPRRAQEVLPRRWVIERTDAWNDSPRRRAKDDDRRLDVIAALAAASLRCALAPEPEPARGAPTGPP